ncbi:DEAD/DEAH box helicase [Roseomonas sp. SSH11]|uniref:DEAD/DEAH box helicase n=1 Tax=Pararoseomonas baculiformis TaxID=2820812 RepID=A0ABS4AJW5_9PROT|nr:DEAD/DEAH box helicase [Pararoseomonas baculiformis]MBP0447318.1 DEAD/DEAH box helicase [Pararoseomonas baculiformis]
MPETRISSLVQTLTSRAAEAAIGRSRIVNGALREHLRVRLSCAAGATGSLIADPVLEAAFGHEPAPATLQELSEQGLLHPETVAALAEAEPLDAAEGRARNTLPRTLRPYTHQVEAWRALKEEDARCVLVSAGTGSGKTESFLVPILDDLVRQRATARRLVGVQALLLYPLNALIASQQDRLADWTAPFGGDVRFCLYNGNTPEELPLARRAERPWEVLDRASLRREPPPVLVTNATMLEYMLLRGKDAPILAASRGRLRYVVLDEAHTYLGSQAAEMTLLLRRTLHAFGVAPEQVRFVATSATLGSAGDPSVARELRRFLADLGGAAEERVSVVLGRRFVPELEQGGYGGLAADSAAVRLRQLLAEAPATLSEARRAVAPASADELLERGIAARGRDGSPFLPLRLHLFHRAQSGVWACIDPSCCGRTGTQLDGPDWPFGKVFERDSPACDACGGRTLGVLLCDDCGAPFLDAAMDAGFTRVERRLDEAALDEFRLEAEVEEDPEDEATEDRPLPSMPFVVGPTGHPGGAQLSVDPRSGEVRDAAGPGTARLARYGHEFCPCCGGGNARGTLFRPIRLGGPFFVGTAVDVLLDAAPPRPPAAPALPHAGRQLITFTDNRQGTARFAALRQQEAERTYVRGFVYHAVQDGDPHAAAEASNLRSEITILEPLGGAAAGLVQAKRARLAELERGGSLPWPSLLDHLAAANADQADLLEMWRGIERRFAEPRELARLQLVTEFLRRPQRANNLETMGLAALRYPAIDGLSEASMPDLFRDRGATLADWQDFLYLTVNFFVRANSAVQIDEGLARWTGQRARTRTFLPPRHDGPTTRKESRWPMLRGAAGRVSRPVLLLRDGLRLDLDDSATRDGVNDALEAAWRVASGLGTPGVDGLRLDLGRTHLSALREAWLCPVTGRVLDRCFRGVTPYVTQNPAPLRPSCERLALPRPPHPWLRREDGSDARDETTAWLGEDPAVAALRRRGLWTDLHDRAALRAPFVRTVEHSAQQPPSRLRDYEQRFKAGRINVLNCSTTMEMGVDIGGITTVAMANVPPSPASYRQRVGRAGRRGESLSVAFTYCPDTPLGWHAFDAPGAPLREAIAPPRVALDSRPLVQRHVNALLLGRFLRLIDANGLLLEAGDFFGPEAGDAAPWKRFVGWLRADALHDQVVSEALPRLLARTALSGVADVAQRSADALSPRAEAWLAERQALAEDLEATDIEAARRAIELQLKRMDGEFLLGDLARAGFLPGHGFPTDVVPFVALSPADQERGAAREREDAGARARRFPTRQLDMAIREYAPGADVVVDGIAYRSAGVTLNWKRPASEEESREVQAVRWFWRCGGCGAAGSAPRRPEACSACGSATIKSERVLQPPGFSTDLLEPPSNAVDSVAFVPPPRPVVSARGTSWTALENPDLGRARASSEGTIMALSRGPTGHGYALCLACGRAEPEASEAREGAPIALPARLARHAPLRGHRRRRPQCDGPDRGFAVQRHIALGYQRQTDLFELQLAALEDEALATTVAVALREALCRRLGVEREEVGWHVDRLPEPGEQPRWSVFLLDTAPGGAGYATSAGAELTDLLRRAREVLQCSNPRCESACPSCLVRRDTGRVVDLLDRRAAAAALDAVLAGLVLPARARLFAEAADQRVAAAPLPLEVERAMASRPAAGLHLLLHGRPGEWDLIPWWATPLLERLGRDGRAVTLLAAPATMAALSFEDAVALKALVDRAGPTVRLAAWSAEPSPGTLLAAVSSRQGCLAWATLDAEAASVSAQPPEAVVRASLPASPVCEGGQADLASIVQRLRPTMHRLSVGTDLDGPVGGFGQRFWAAIGRLPAVSGWLARSPRVERIAYGDRYLFSPLVVRMLHSVLAAAPVPRTAGRRLPLQLMTLSDRYDRRSGMSSGLRDDWPNLNTRDDVLKAVLGHAGFDVHLETADRRGLPHARRLRLESAEHGAMEVLLDHGFGHWMPERRVPFDFSAGAARQGADLLRTGVSVVGEPGKATEIFVDLTV